MLERVLMRGIRPLPLFRSLASFRGFERGTRRAASAGILTHFDAGRGCLPSSSPPQEPSSERSETLTARLEIGELVEARAGGREQHDLPGDGCPARLPTARSSSPHRSGGACAPASARRSSARPRRSGRRPRSCARPLAQRAEVLVLALPAEDQVDPAARSKASSATSVLATFVAFESLTNSTPPRLVDLLEAVCDACERAQPLAHGLRVDARAPGIPPRRPSRSGRCGARQAQLARRAAARARATTAAGRAQERAAPGPLPKHTRRAQPPRSSTPSPSGATATSSLPWRAKISSLAFR